MLDGLQLLADLALFILTVVVVGKKPTAPKVTVMILVVAAVDFGFTAIAAAQMQMNPIEAYRQALSEAMGAYSNALGQTLDYEQTIVVVSNLVPALYVLSSAAEVFVALIIRWAVNRIRNKSEWSAFSKVDLSIWWLLLLLAGVSCYTVSIFVPRDIVFTVQIVAGNLLLLSTVPLFVQGTAAGKGIMNRAGIGPGLQIVIGVLGIFTGLFFVVVVILGLIDFWANFRKLPRADGSTREESAN